MKFPDIENFTPHFENGVDLSCATLDGVYGAMLNSKIYGLTVHYFSDNWPSTDTSQHFSREQLEKLNPFQLEQNPAFQELMHQMDVIESKWGKISGYLNYQTIFYKGIMPSEKVLDLPVDCNTLAGSVNL